MNFKLPVFLGFSFAAMLVAAQSPVSDGEVNDNILVDGPAVQGNLSDGALLLEDMSAESGTGNTENETQDNLPVAENVDLKEIVKNEQLGALPETGEVQPNTGDAATAVKSATGQPASGPKASDKQSSDKTEVENHRAENQSKTAKPETNDNAQTAAHMDQPRAEPDPGKQESSADAVSTKPTAESPAEAELPLKASLKLLSSEVLPGTSARLAWEPSVSFMGISAPTAVLVVNGVREGPTLCLTSAVHGDELNGIEVVRHILYNIDPHNLSGAIIGVPIVNLQGFRRSSRYLPDRRDLNRYFPGNPNGSAASRIAFSFFDEVVRHCDMLVDIHTGSFKRTNLPQLRADLAYKKVADLSGKMGAIVVVQSKGHSGSLRRAAVEHGVPAVTLEAGEPHILDKEAVSSGVKSIQTLLHAEGMAKTLAFWELRRGPVYYKSRWVRSVNGGILFSDVGLGANVKEGDVLGTVTDPITNLSTDIVSPHNGKVIGMALNQVLYPGYAAYHIGLQAPAKEAAEDINDAEAAPSVEMSEESNTMEEELEREQDSEAVMEVQILEDSE